MSDEWIDNLRAEFIKNQKEWESRSRLRKFIDLMRIKVPYYIWRIKYTLGG